MALTTVPARFTCSAAEQPIVPSGMITRTTDTGTVSRTVAILRAVAEAEGNVQIKTLADTLSLPPPTVHRLLELLIKAGMIERNESARLYGVGREFFRLSSLVTSRHSLTAVALPLLREAVAQCNETAYLGVYLPGERKMIFAADCESSHPLGYRVRKNEPLSLLTGASGLSILAHLPKKDMDRAYEESRDDIQVRKARPSRKALESELAIVRAQGYALTFGKRISGAVGIFAAVFNRHGEVIGCLGYTIPEQRYSKNLLPRLSGTVCRVAMDLSGALGYQEKIRA